MRRHHHPGNDLSHVLGHKHTTKTLHSDQTHSSTSRRFKVLDNLTQELLTHHMAIVYTSLQRLRQRRVALQKQPATKHVTKPPTTTRHTHVSNAVSCVMVDGSVWRLLPTQYSLFHTRVSSCSTNNDHPHCCKRCIWPSSRGSVRRRLLCRNKSTALGNMVHSSAGSVSSKLPPSSILSPQGEPPTTNISLLTL